MVLLELCLMKFIPRISKKIKWKVSGVTRSIIDELRSSDFQADQMEGESGVTRSIIDKLQSSDIRLYQMVGESGVT